MRRRILLGTPVYADVKVPFHLGICEILTTAYYNVQFIPSVVRGTYVQTARDELVAEARRLKCHDILFCDADLAVTAQHAERILSHDEPIVGGVYAKRVSGEPQWTSTRCEGAEKGDLVPCNPLASGFMLVRMDVFDAIDAKFPHRRYQHGSEPERMQYFPLALCEKGSHRHPAEAKLEAIAAILEGATDAGDIMNSLGEISRIMGRKVPAEVVGDDGSFSRLAIAAGFTPYADQKCLIRHWGDASFPAKELPLQDEPRGSCSASEKTDYNVNDAEENRAEAEAYENLLDLLRKCQNGR